MASKYSCGKSIFDLSSADNFSSVDESSRKFAVGYGKRAAAVLAAATLGLCAIGAHGQVLPGGIYVERIGGTSTFTDTGTLPAGPATTQLPLFIDAFSPNGTTPEKTVTIPTTDSGVNHGVTTIVSESGGTSITSASTGYIQASPNGRYLTFAGTGVAAGMKVIGKLDSLNSSLDTSTQIANGASAARSAITPDGVNYYFTAQSGQTDYIQPGVASIQVNSSNQRVVGIFGGQLFTDGNATNGGTPGGPAGPGIDIIGAGTPIVPTSSNTAAGGRYIMTVTKGGMNAGDLEQFVMLDQDPTKDYVNSVGDPSTSYNTHLDVTYIAADDGIEKWTLDSNGNWAYAYTLSGGLGTTSKITTRMAGVTFVGKDASGNNVLYATTAGDDTDSSQPEGNALMKIADSGAGATWSLVTTSSDNTWLRGVQVIHQSGDANGDFKVDSSDFAVISANFGKTGVTGGFASGDFNYDGTVNALDFNALASNFGYDQSAGILGPFSGAVPLGSVVPEPMSLSLIGLSGLALMQRRRRA